MSFILWTVSLRRELIFLLPECLFSPLIFITNQKPTKFLMPYNPTNHCWRSIRLKGCDYAPARFNSPRNNGMVAKYSNLTFFHLYETTNSKNSTPISVKDVCPFASFLPVKHLVFSSVWKSGMIQTPYKYGGGQFKEGELQKLGQSSFVLLKPRLRAQNFNISH